MPYIKGFQRLALKAKVVPEKAGELNYTITRLCAEYLERKGECYDMHNEIIGVLECVKQEWYRRKTAIYEDKKMVENGDVYFGD